MDDEQLLSTALTVELEDAKKTLVQLKFEKPKSTHSRLFSLNVDYYIKKVFEERDSIESRLQTIETGKQHRNWNI